jgi:hypothetical protein
MSDVDMTITPPTREELAQEIISIRREMENLVVSIDETRVALQRLIHVFNERITDIYGEINHIKIYGNNNVTIPRQNIVLHDYFTYG